MIRTRNFCFLKKSASRAASEKGVTIAEMLIVVVILMILSTISIALASNYKRRYKSEDQSLTLLDNMREASQLALTKRRVFRVEINSGTNRLHLIDENGTNPDVILKSIPLEPINEIRMDTAPTGIGVPVPPNYAPAVYAAGIWTARFNSDGSVVDPAGVPVSATIFVWPPQDPGSADARADIEVRAVTIFGGSGATRYWKYDGTAFMPYQ